MGTPDSTPIFAYIDPGTGSYLLQITLAGLLGAGYTLRVLWGRMTRFMGRSRQSSTRPADRPNP